MKNQWIHVSALLGGGLVSLCCGVPLALAVLGLGSLGLTQYIAEYHWFFTGGGILAVAIGWGIFLREKKKADRLGSHLDNEKFTKAVLGVVSALVISFSGFSIYSQVKDPGTQSVRAHAVGRVVTVTVKGMTCGSCELHVQGALKKLPGINRAIASARKGTVVVDFDPAKCNRAAITRAINSTGYRVVGPI